MENKLVSSFDIIACGLYWVIHLFWPQKNSQAINKLGGVYLCRDPIETSEMPEMPEISNAANGTKHDYG